MSEWITDRQPTAQDGDSEGLIWIWDYDNKVRRAKWSTVIHGTPWQRILVPAPYVKPKTFSAVWSDTLCKWNIVHCDGLIVATLRIDVEGMSTAQRICDIYNEVMP